MQKKIILTGLIAAALTACGGGSDSNDTVSGDDSAAVAATPAASAATPAASAPAPAASAATSLPMLAFSNTGVITAQTATLTGTGSTAVLSFTDPAFSITGPNTNTPSTADNLLRKIKGGGAAVLYCAGGIVTDTTTSPVASVKAAYEGGRLFITTDAILVTDVAAEMPALVGRTFESSKCAGSEAPFTIQADGSASSTRGNTPAASIAAFLSPTGLVDNGNVYKAKLYKITLGGTLRYYIAESNSEPTNYGGINFMKLHWTV